MWTFISRYWIVLGRDSWSCLYMRDHCKFLRRRGMQVTVGWWSNDLEWKGMHVYVWWQVKEVHMYICTLGTLKKLSLCDWISLMGWCLNQNKNHNLNWYILVKGVRGEKGVLNLTFIISISHLLNVSPFYLISCLLKGSVAQHGIWWVTCPYPTTSSNKSKGKWVMLPWISGDKLYTC